jgi:flagella basal body P-ring formation protein FlgA
MNSLIRKTTGAGLGLAVAALASVTALAGDRVVALTRVVYPGQAVTLDAMTMVELQRPMAGSDKALREMDALVGKIARKTMLPNRLLFADNFSAPAVIESGQTVAVAFATSTMAITLTAVALESAGIGDTVRVRNRESGRIIFGQVSGDGTIIVGTP